MSRTHGSIRLLGEGAPKGKTSGRGENKMKYMLLMSTTKEGFEWFSKWPKEDLKANFAFMRAINKELTDSGVLVSTAGLGWPDQAVMVRAGKDGEPITDGVFPEAKEFLAGYWIIDVDTPERAYQIAAEASAAPGPRGEPLNLAIEVRQVMSGPPQELP